MFTAFCRTAVKFSLLLLLSGILLGGLIGKAQAQSVLTLSLTNPNQFAGGQGDTLLYRGTITNNTGADIASDQLNLSFTNAPQINISQVLGLTPFTIANNSSSGVVDFFQVQFVPQTSTAGVAYGFSVSVDDGNGNASTPPASGTAGFNAPAGSAAPEPGTLCLLGGGGLVGAWGKRRVSIKQTIKGK